MKKSYSNIGSIGLVFMLTAIYGNTKAQTKTVTGTVTVGENQSPLSGVIVSQEGSDQVTQTNSKGNYHLEITGENPSIIFRHPEYAEKRITVGGKTIINILLDQKVQGIEEVVLNAGYYKVKEKESTGSIAKVSAKDIENQPVTNVLSAMQGRLSGVSITQNSGVPGGGFDIQIRGRNSLRNKDNSTIDGNQPLYVIDGVPMGGEMTSLYSTAVLPARSLNPLNSINPNDIEKIEILKDADATAIYGSRGANGVVLVTTKRGKSKRLNLNFNTAYGLSTIISNLKLMNTNEYLAMRKKAFSNDGISTYPATAYDVNNIWNQERYTDWPDKLIGNTATLSNTQLSLNGGSDTTNFLLSLSNDEQTTVFGEDFKYKSKIISSHITHKSVDNKFQLNIANSFSIQKNNVIRTDITKQAYNLVPNAPELYNSEGGLNWENNTFANPVAAYNSTYNNENKQFLNSITTQYEVYKQLFLKLNGGFNYQTFEELSLQPNTIYNPAFAAGQSSATSIASKNNQDRFSFIVEPQINWNYQLGNHKFDALIGGTFQKEVNKQGSIVGVGFESNAFITNVGAARTKTVSDQITNEYRYAAFFGRINYQYLSRYIINITGRRDGSSRFGSNNKFANFAAVGGAWIFKKEKFAENLNWLSFGKIRGSYGTAGSDNIGDYQYLDTYTVSSAYVYNSVTGLIPSRLYNGNYSWEKTKKLEFALELGLFNDRLNLNTAWYRNLSSNQLVGYQLPSITGFTSVLANLNATVENKGWEFELSGRPLKSADVKWDTVINISFPTNKLISFPGLEGSTYANQYIIGQSTSIIKLYQLEGINPQTGKYIFTDFNGDGKISSPEDNKVFQDISVKYFGGWTNSFKYKKWDLSFLFQFVKQKNRNYNSIITVPGSMNNQPIEVLNVWSSENQNGLYMPYTSVANTLHTFFQNSTASVSDASFIRLKNLQIGYQIPLNNSTFKNVKIYFQGQNLLTITNYFGVDPEFLALGYLPPLKTYSFGLQLNL